MQRRLTAGAVCGVHAVRAWWHQQVGLRVACIKHTRGMKRLTEDHYCNMRRRRSIHVPRSSGAAQAQQ